MADYKFDAKELFNSIPQATILIAAPSAQLSVRGVLTSSISIGGTNHYSSPFEDIKFVKNIEQIIKVAGAGLQQLPVIGPALAGMSQFNLKTPEMTSVVWGGSDRPTFDVNFVLIALESSEDIRKTVKEMLKTVYPTDLVAKGLTRGTYQAPLGFSYKYDSKQNISSLNGAVAVQIGKWFRATNQVPLSFSADFSNETTQAGYPLFAECRFSFQPYRLPKVSDVASYISTDFAIDTIEGAG